MPLPWLPCSVLVSFGGGVGCGGCGVLFDLLTSWFVGSSFLMGWGWVGQGFLRMVHTLLSACALWGVGVVVGFVFDGEFDPGSGRTLAACFTHASRTMMTSLLV